MKFVPNILSMLRLVLSFCLIPLVLNECLSWTLIVFTVAAITDFLDGYIARKFSICSKFGAALDPLADKVLMTVSYVLFAVVNFIPVYVSVIVITRDILIVLAVFMCNLRNVHLEIKPIMASKINTTIQLMFLVLVIMFKYFSVDAPIEIGSIIVSISTVFSGVEYARKYFWIKDAIFKH